MNSVRQLCVNIYCDDIYPEGQLDFVIPFISEHPGMFARCSIYPIVNTRLSEMRPCLSSQISSIFSKWSQIPDYHI